VSGYFLRGFSSMGNEVLPVNDKDIDFKPDDDMPNVQPVPRRHSTDDADGERKLDRDQTRNHEGRSLNGHRTQGVGRRLSRQRAPRNRDDQSRPPQPPAPPH
jgi:hypothetical protein